MDRRNRRKCRRRMHQAHEALVKARDWLGAGAAVTQISEPDLAFRVRALSYVAKRLVADLELIEEKMHKEDVQFMRDAKKALTPEGGPLDTTTGG